MMNEEQKDIELMLRLDELFREIRSLIQSYWGKHSTVGIGLNHARLLTTIAEQGPMKASNLADKLHITCGAVTGLADKLIELGLIQRAKDASDRRVVMLTLTEAGMERAEEIKLFRQELMLHLFDDMSNEEMKFGLHLFTKLQNNMLQFENEQQEGPGDVVKSDSL